MHEFERADAALARENARDRVEHVAPARVHGDRARLAHDEQVGALLEQLDGLRCAQHTAQYVQAAACNKVYTVYAAASTSTSQN